MSEGLRKLDQLRKAFLHGDEESQEQIKTWERQLKRSLALLDLANHDGVKLLLNQFQANIEAVNTELTERRTMTLRERELLFVRRDCWQQFLRIFEDARNHAEGIEREIETNLE